MHERTYDRVTLTGQLLYSMGFYVRRSELNEMSDEDFKIVYDYATMGTLEDIPPAILNNYRRKD